MLHLIISIWTELICRNCRLATRLLILNVQSRPLPRLDRHGRPTPWALFGLERAHRLCSAIIDCLECTAIIPSVQAFLLLLPSFLGALAAATAAGCVAAAAKMVSGLGLPELAGLWVLGHGRRRSVITFLIFRAMGGARFVRLGDGRG